MGACKSTMMELNDDIIFMLKNYQKYRPEQREKIIASVIEILQLIQPPTLERQTGMCKSKEDITNL
jgi:hypothetical protein